MTEADKVYQEARRQIWSLVYEHCKRTDTSDIPIEDQILNLKGAGWKIAIVSTRFSDTLYPDTNDEMRLKQVIWDGE